MALLISFNAGCFGAFTSRAATVNLQNPTNLRMTPASNTDTSVVVAWEKPSDYKNVEGYNVYVNDAFVGSTNMTYFKPTGLDASTKYKIKVRAYDSKGELSYDSNAIEVTTTAAPQIYNVKDYGATGDGTTKDTVAIQKAIDACKAGGEVYLPAGTYLSGALYLHSNMTFYVDAGAQLKESSDLADFPAVTSNRFSTECPVAYGSLLNAGKMDHTAGATTTNIKIMGPGTIGDMENGMALRATYDALKTTDGAGQLITLKNCGNVYLDGVHIRNGMNWTIVPIYSENITAYNLDVNTSVHNGDGFDPNSSKNIYILGTHFSTGDDCSAIKSGLRTDLDKDGKVIERPSDHIYYRGDVFNSGHGGITIGSESAGGISDVYAEDCIITPVDLGSGSTNAGIRVKTSPSRGAYLKNLQVRDSIVDQISVITNYAKESGATPGVTLPDIENFRFTNLTAPSYTSNSSQNISISGSNFGESVSYLKDVQFNNCKFYSASLDTCQNVAFNNCDIKNGIATTTCTNITKDGAGVGLPSDNPGPAADDNFEKDAIGALPPTWKINKGTTGCSIGVQGDSSNKYLYLQHNAGVTGYEIGLRSFATQTTVVTNSFKVKYDTPTSLADANNSGFYINSSGGKSAVLCQVVSTDDSAKMNLSQPSGSKTIIPDLKTGTWYNLKFVMDIPNQVMDVYVNDSKVADAIPFYQTATDLNSFFYRLAKGGSSSGECDVSLDDFNITATQVPLPKNKIAAIEVSNSKSDNTITAKDGSLDFSAKVYPSDYTGSKTCKWDVINPDLTKSDAATIDDKGHLTAKKNGVVLVTATATDGSGTMGMYPLTITGQQSFVSFAPVDVVTTTNVAPVLPKTVYELADDGTSLPASVKWDDISKDKYSKAGTFTVNGEVEETSTKVIANVTVSDVAVKSIKTAIVKATPGSLNLPNLVTAVLNDGTTKLVCVKWDNVDSSKYAKVNVKGFKVSGTVSGTDLKATAQVSVLPVVVKGITPILVAADGTGDYRTINEAIKSIPSDNAQRKVIFVKEGTYKEKLVIDRAYVSLVGQSANGTVITYDDSPMTTNGALGTYTDFTVQVTGHDFSAKDITFENSAGSTSGQSVALDVIADHASFTNCRMLGYQDTLLTRNGTTGADTTGTVTDNVPNQVTNHTYRQYFKNCFISGAVDFIFGPSEAIFDQCELHSRLKGYYTAACTPQNQPYGYVFLNCNLTAEHPYSGYFGVSLGRDWRQYAATSYINCTMGPQINADGWSTMSTSDLSTCRYSEYKSVDPNGAPVDVSKRAKYTTQLTDDQAAKYTVSNLFSKANGIDCADSWDPTVLAVPTIAPTKPVTIDDNITMKGNSYTGSVAKDAQNDDGNALKFSLVDKTKNGTVAMNSDGSYTYKPSDPTHAGTDSFTYKATNKNLDSNVSKVTIDIQAQPAASTNASGTTVSNGNTTQSKGDTTASKVDTSASKDKTTGSNQTIPNPKTGTDESIPQEMFVLMAISMVLLIVEKKIRKADR